MNIYKSIIIILSLIVAVFIGSLLVAIVRADEPIETTEPITTTCATNEPMTSDETGEPIETTCATNELPTVNECEPITSDEPLTHEAIIERDTGLHVDYIQLIDEYTKGNWCVLYVHCDGDLYVITIKNNCVDVCCILN